MDLVSEGIPIDRVTLTELMNTPIIIRIATVVDVTSLSILELLEYNINIGDIIFAIANGVLVYDNLAQTIGIESNDLGIAPSVNYYFSFVKRKVKLSQLGIHILESIKGTQVERNSPSNENQNSYTDPRHQSTIS